jgi:molecular chaperone DnaJ
MGRNYYQVLCVSSGAAEEDIRRAYRRLAFERHPDRNPHDGESERLFYEVVEAYGVLGDPQKRAAYDRELRFSLDSQAFVRGATEDHVVGGGRTHLRNQPVDQDTIQGEPPGRGADLRYDLHLSKREATRGGEITFDVPRFRVCGRCGGKPMQSRVRAETCSRCGGEGRIAHKGPLRMAVVCPSCLGQGRYIVNRCPACKGVGHVRQVDECLVRVPAGSRDGNSILLSGEGGPGSSGGPPGDLHVVLRVRAFAPSRTFGTHHIGTAFPWIRK